MNICIFEDNHFHQLYPLSLTRPVYELRCGIYLLREKIKRLFPDSKLYLFCRSYLTDVVRAETPDANVNTTLSEDCLLINGRFLFTEVPRKIGRQETVWKKNGAVAAAWMSGSRLASLVPFFNGIVPDSWFEGLPEQTVNGAFVSYPWDLIRFNPKAIKQDFDFIARGGERIGKIYDGVQFIDKKNIYIGDDAKIEPGVVLNAEEGPIFISKGASIMANSSIQGPVFVGENSVIKMGAKIYEGTSIGEVCKVGGEVEESIIHSYTNKQHDGFLGHAYLGQWVNIGADSNNSDLKNNYSNVKVFVNGSLVDTGSQFVGLFMGDHSKCAINTMFNTGTIVGVMANVFGSGFPVKFVPSFSWGGIDQMTTYDLEKALKVSKHVMKRRNKELTIEQEKMLRHVFDITEIERQW